MSDTKTYQVSFYTTNVLDGTEQPPTLGEAFSQLVEGDLPYEFVHPVDGLVYQLRELEQMPGGRYRGVVAKFRYSDIPNIGDRSTTEERPIDLEDQEGLIEKNFFLFDPALNLMTYQINGNGCNINRVAEIFDALATGKFGHLANVNLSPVLRPDAIERILNGDMQVRKLEVGFSKPTNAATWASQEQFSGELLHLLNALGGASMNITVSANPAGRSAVRSFLSDFVKTGVAHFAQ
ncbi:MAG: hypothetical protein GYB21_04675 [Oceanospirillales bacterium]|nr:hypothetical protein [Oceanospirillales bacterium]